MIGYDGGMLRLNYICRKCGAMRTAGFGKLPKCCDETMKRLRPLQTTAAHRLKKSERIEWLITKMPAFISGELAEWPPKNRMADILKSAGLGVVVGRYSIRVKECSHFVFQEYGGDLEKPMIDADADSVEEMASQGKLVSDALAHAGIRHRFEIYNDNREMVGYLHHDWPLPTS